MIIKKILKAIDFIIVRNLIKINSKLLKIAFYYLSNFKLSNITIYIMFYFINQLIIK